MQAANVLVRLEHIADLLPGIVHVLFGVGFHDLGAVICGNTEARIEIEAMHPVGGVGRGCSVAVEQNALRQRMPASIERRSDQRVGIVGNVRNDRLRDARAAWRDPLAALAAAGVWVA